MNVKTILVVDDDALNRATCRSALQRAGFNAVVADSAEAALRVVGDARPDVVVSDVQMPGAGGFGLCENLRKTLRTRRVPLLLMSGVRTTEEDRIDGLERGADDYLVKPFSPRYLVAKVRTVLRRYDASDELSGILAAEGMTLDASARTVTICENAKLRLTRKEFDLLAVFLRKPGRVLSPLFLLESVWGWDPADYNDTHTVLVHVASLRRKLGPGLGRRIVTVHGAGYRFDPGRARI